ALGGSKASAGSPPARTANRADAYPAYSASHPMDSVITGSNALVVRQRRTDITHTPTHAYGNDAAEPIGSLIPPTTSLSPPARVLLNSDAPWLGRFDDPVILHALNHPIRHPAGRRLVQPLTTLFRQPG